ncbi:MAG TPA: hypothetical protein VGK23_10935 [Methanomassiliicoccales archaeon]|jgi:hypothetical protein
MVDSMHQGVGAADQEIIDRLVSSDDPTVRLAAMTELGGFRGSDPEVFRARQEAMRSGPIPKILAAQDPGGFWGREEQFYVGGKYKGTVWNFILLAQLEADGSDGRIRAASEFLWRWSQHECGGFGYQGNAEGSSAESILPCLTGNLVWSMLRFGMKDDSRVRTAIEWIAKYQRFDDNEGPAPKGWPYTRKNCWGKHTCHMGVVKDLKAISLVPKDERSTALANVASAGAEHLLKHRLFKRSHDPSQIAKKWWINLGFPLMWDTDALEMLEVLTDLGYRDERMEDAIELVLSKRRSDGLWRNERSYNGRIITTIEKQGAPSQWVTLRALAVLKKLDRL